MRIVGQIFIIAVALGVFFGSLGLLQHWRFNQCIEGGGTRGVCLAIISR